MSLPVQDQNMVGTHVYPIADLSMTAFLASGASGTGTFTTGQPATVVVLASLTSGAGTMYLTTAATQAAVNYNISPTVSLTLSGTSLLCQVVCTTNNATALNQDYTQLDQYSSSILPTSSLWVGVANVAGTYTNLLFNQFAILVNYELVGGEDYFCVRGGSCNAVAGTWGNYPLGNDALGYADGSGNVNLNVA